MCVCVCVCVCVCAAVQSVCESRPGVCGRGRCVDLPAGKHTCVCDRGYQPNSQRTYCQGEHTHTHRHTSVVNSSKKLCWRERGSNYTNLMMLICVCVCVDVNECVQSPGVCSVGECVNTMGSYRCVCPSGYRSNSQQTSCQGDVYFLFVCLFVCLLLHTNKRCHRCVSPSDVDECQQNPCSSGRCDNTPGSYRCVCRLGYRLSGNTCTGKAPW